MTDADDFQLVDRLFALARSLTPTRDWSRLLVEAGPEPDDVIVTVLGRRFRNAAGVRVEDRATGSSCEVVGNLTVEENTAAAIAGFVDGTEHAE